MRDDRISVFAPLLFWGILTVLCACSVTHKISYLLKENLTKNDPLSKVRGQTLFLTNCAECHGADAHGGVNFPIVIPNLIEFAKTNTENAVAYKISTGSVYHMPDFDRYLSETEVWDITNYLESLK